MEHKHSPEEERKIREAALDETLEATFPASDPLSSDPNPDDDDAGRRDERSRDQRDRGAVDDFPEPKDH
jgi:hypothetical protein